MAEFGSISITPIQKELIGRYREESFFYDTSRSCLFRDFRFK